LTDPQAQGGAGGDPPPAPLAVDAFGARLAAAVHARESQVVVGIDPDPDRLWPAATERAAEARTVVAAPPGDARFDTAVAVLAHAMALIDAAGPACVAAKPQLAFFEQLGFAGWLALEHVCAHARAAGLLVIADAKRGDVPSTAAAYSRALTGPSPGLAADAITANPLMGRDAVEPLVTGARERGAGAFLLVRTSNPGATDVLDLQLATGEPLWERLAVMTAELGEGEEALSDIGAVTGATVPGHLARMRELMPRTPFLLPGIGAQGGDVAALAPAFAPGKAAGLVSASRSIAGAADARGGDPARAARAEAERLRETAWNLA